MVEEPVLLPVVFPSPLLCASLPLSGTPNSKNVKNPNRRLLLIPINTISKFENGRHRFLAKVVAVKSTVENMRIKHEKWIEFRVIKMRPKIGYRVLEERGSDS